MADRQDTGREVYVGIDYHKPTLQVCVLDPAGAVLANRTTRNSRQEVVRVASACGRVRRAALEVGTGSAAFAEELVVQEGWLTELAHPGYVARMKGSPDKTDFSDARLLADLTRVGYLPRVWLAPPWVRELRRLVRYRQQVVEERRSTKLRIRALLRDHRLGAPTGVRAWTKAWWQWLSKEVLAALPRGSRFVLEQHRVRLARVAEDLSVAEEALRSFTASDALIGRLRTLAGVGEVTAWLLRAEIGQFERFRDGKALARFCGVSPRNASSGSRQADAGLVRAGSGLLRATLIELAHRLCRWEPRWRSLKERLVAAGKAGSVATAALANRWVRWLQGKKGEKGDRGKKGTGYFSSFARSVPR